MKKVWIDTDPGIDDAFAMAMLFASPDIEVVGISTIFGNVTVEQTTKNTRILLEAAGKTHIPVCRGAIATLAGLFPQRRARRSCSRYHFGLTRQATVAVRTIAVRR